MLSPRYTTQREDVLVIGDPITAGAVHGATSELKLP